MSQQLGITTASDGLPMYESGPQAVVIKNIDMTIGAMCIFMVKWAIAAIPAALILGLIWVIVVAMFMAVFH